MSKPVTLPRRGDSPSGRFIASGLCLLLWATLAAADDWPQWRGPDRDGISDEKGLLQKWEDKGPPLARTIVGMGTGKSSPIIARGHLVITGHVDKEQVISCFSLDGKKQWEAKNGPFQGARYGAQSSVLVDGDTVFVVSEVGRVAALARDSGEERWSRAFGEFKARIPRYRYAESVVASKDRVFCQPGGPDASIVALDKETGKTVWKSTGMDDTVTYCSGIVVEIQGVLQLVTVTEVGLVGIDEKTGALLWRFDPPYKGARNCLTPVLWKDHVFAESGHKGAGAILKISKENDALEATRVWQTAELPSHLGGHVGMNGKVYGHNGRGWVCRDILTGKELHTNRDIKNCSTIYADQRFYCLSNTGTMYLVEANEKKSRIVSQFTIPNAGPQTWARAAIADGHLYLRHLDKVFVYDIRRNRGQPNSPESASH